MLQQISLNIVIAQQRDRTVHRSDSRMRDAPELQYFLNPSGARSRMILAQLYLRMGINYPQVKIESMMVSQSQIQDGSTLFLCTSSENLYPFFNTWMQIEEMLTNQTGFTVPQIQVAHGMIQFSRVAHEEALRVAALEEEHGPSPVS